MKSVFILELTVELALFHFLSVSLTHTHIKHTHTDKILSGDFKMVCFILVVIHT